MEERLSAKQAELERQQQQQRQDLAQMREMFSLMFDKVSGDNTTKETRPQVSLSQSAP